MESTLSEFISVSLLGLAGALGFQAFKPLVWGRWLTVFASLPVLFSYGYVANGLTDGFLTTSPGGPGVTGGLSSAAGILFASSAIHGWLLNGTTFGEKIRLNLFARLLGVVSEFAKAAQDAATKNGEPTPPAPPKMGT